MAIIERCFTLFTNEDMKTAFNCVHTDLGNCFRAMEQFLDGIKAMPPERQTVARELCSAYNQLLYDTHELVVRAQSEACATKVPIQLLLEAKHLGKSDAERKLLQDLEKPDFGSRMLAVAKEFPAVLEKWRKFETDLDQEIQQCQNLSSDSKFKGKCFAAAATAAGILAFGLPLAGLATVAGEGLVVATSVSAWGGSVASALASAKGAFVAMGYAAIHQAADTIIELLEECRKDATVIQTDLMVTGRKATTFNTESNAAQTTVTYGLTDSPRFADNLRRVLQLYDAFDNQLSALVETIENARSNYAKALTNSYKKK